jgi:arabinosyltransferase B/arabinosyltransferase C
VAVPAPALPPRQWQDIPVHLPASTPTAVRLVVEDRVPGADTALAVAAPHLSKMQPASTVTHRRAVFADQLSALLWPNVEQVAVRHGIAPTPQVRLSAAENTPPGILDNPTYEPWGGTLVPSQRIWATVRVVSAVTPGGPPTPRWGHVDRIVYDLPTDGYDLRVDHVTRGGTVRYPTLATESYDGHAYQTGWAVPTVRGTMWPTRPR